MFWYIREPKDSGTAILKYLNEIDEEGLLTQMDKKEIFDLARKVQDMQMARGRFFFEPPKKMLRWYLMPYFIRAISGGNRAGKTASCVLDVVMQAEGWHPLQKKNLEILAADARFKWVREIAQTILNNRDWIKAPPISARCVAVDYDNFVAKVIGPEYEKWATQSELEQVAYDNEKKRVIRWKNGSRVEFMTYKQEVDAHGGAARDVIHFDEEPPEDIYQENMMRVISTNGRMILGMTAVNGITWTEESIWQPGLNDSKEIYAVELSTYDNPINSEEVVNKIKNMCMSETEVDIRIHGKRKARGGNVYHMYRDEEPWVVEKFRIPQKDGLLICAIDPHPKTAHAVVWVWVDFDGKIHKIQYDKPNCYATAGLFTTGHIPYLVSMMRYIEKTDIGREHDICLCDPSAWNIDQTKEISKSISDQLVENGVYPRKGSKDLKGGLIKVAEMLSLEWTYESEGLLKRERPQFMIMETGEDRQTGLGRLRWEIMNYRWQSRSVGSRSKKSVPEKPVDADDHLVESMRRICEFVFDNQFELQDVSESIFSNITLTSRGKVVDVNWKEQTTEQKWIENFAS